MKIKKKILSNKYLNKENTEIDSNYSDKNKQNLIKITKYCLNYLQNKKCNDKCYRAHSKNEINIKVLENFKFDYNFFIFHYKTEICPFDDYKHSKITCIYAHNENELRRCYNPNLKPKLCDKLKKIKTNEEINKKCKKKMNCNFCHNNYEYQYHPLIYKTIECDKKCRNKFLCSKYHDSSEKEIYKYSDKFYFKFVPRNPNISKIKFTKKINEINYLEISFNSLEKLEKKKIIEKNTSQNRNNKR